MAEGKHLKSFMCHGLISAELSRGVLDYYPLLAEVSGYQEVVSIHALECSWELYKVPEGKPRPPHMH